MSSLRRTTKSYAGLFSALFLSRFLLYLLELVGIFHYTKDAAHLDYIIGVRASARIGLTTLLNVILDASTENLMKIAA